MFLILGSQNNPLVEFMRANMVYVIAATWSGVGVFVAAWRGIFRFYGYAAALSIGVISSQWVGSMGLNLTAVGLLVTACGFITLWLFTKKYPILEEGME